MVWHLTRMFMGSVLVFFLSGCMMEPPAAPATILVTCKVPVITPQPETKETQEKGGIEISAAPVQYTTSLQQHNTIRQVPSPFISVKGRGDEIYVERASHPTAEVSPDLLHFVIKVNNKMPRVFHGAGTVVQFNVGGRLQAVDQMGYNNFLGAIIPPRQEQQIEIVGPPLSCLTADKGIIGVFLYDVVTDQNTAGVVTEKQNFEWYFDYVLEQRQQQVQPHSEQMWMSAYQYQQELTRINLEAAGIRPGDPRYPSQR